MERGREALPSWVARAAEPADACGPRTATVCGFTIAPWFRSERGHRPDLDWPFKVLDVRDAPRLPELHVESLASASAVKTGWIYVQTLDLWDPKSPSRPMISRC